MTHLDHFAAHVEGFVPAKGRYASCVFAFMSRESAAQSPPINLFRWRGCNAFGSAIRCIGSCGRDGISER